MKLIYFGKMQRYFRLDGLNELLKNKRGISVGRMISTAINRIEWPSLCLCQVVYQCGAIAEHQRSRGC